jgi:hypothetical protein
MSMQVSTSIRTAAGLCAAAMLFAGCAGTSSQMTPQARGLAMHRPSGPTTSGRTWMDPAAKGGDLLYVATAGNSAVEIYSYPKLKQVGALTDTQWPEGLCSDKAGNVWVTNYEFHGYLPGYMTEYAHGGTKIIATLQDANQSPGDCSIDPTTGNLAIANRIPATGEYSSGNIGIYTKAKGDPVTYTSPDIFFYYWCTYDDKGNLFVNGFNSASQVVFVELPKGSRKFKTLQLDEPMSWPVGIRWDGKYLAAGNGNDTNPFVYRFQIHGNKATTVSSMQLNGASSIAQFTVFGKNIIVPSVQSGIVGIYAYPAGGDTVKTINEGNEPVGTVISTAK